MNNNGKELADKNLCKECVYDGLCDAYQKIKCYRFRVGTFI